MLLVGIAIDLGLLVIGAPPELWQRILLFLGGLLLLAVATGLYIGARMGPGPRDGLMTGLRSRTSWPIWAIRSGLEGSVLVIGWLLGGQVGLGTVAFVVLIGPLVHVAMPLLRVPGGEPEAPAVVRERPFQLSAWSPAGLLARGRNVTRDDVRAHADLRAIAQRDARVEEQVE
jgi:hypothetical protein